ncbi:hypothetical protein BH09VER1_BH09VER1_20600 [soil metagenome]
MKPILAIIALSLLVLATPSQAGEQPKPYPLKTCLVSGEKLGEMGTPVVYVYEGQEYKFCCNSCLKKFEADPTKYSQELGKAGS